MLEVGQLVRLADESQAEVQDLLSAPPDARFRVTEVDTDTDDEHWPGCPSSHDCCCMPLTFQIVRLAGLNGRWYPSYLFTAVTPPA